MGRKEKGKGGFDIKFFEQRPCRNAIVIDRVPHRLNFNKNNSVWLPLEVFVIDSILNLLPWYFCFVLRGTLKMCVVDAMRITYLVLATETLNMTQFICHKICCQSSFVGVPPILDFL